MKKGLFRICLIGLAALLALAVLEVVLRVADKPKPLIAFEPFESHLNRVHAEHMLSVMEGDPELFWKLKPNSRLPDDAQGLRGLIANGSSLREPKEISQDKPADEIRILFLGDSCTFGFGSLEADTYVAQAEALLRKRHPELDLELINAGVPGYTICQGWRFLESRGLAYHPDLVVTAFGWNDSRVWSTRSDLDMYHLYRDADPGPALRRSKLCSKLAEIRAKRRYPPAEEEKVRVSIEEFETILGYIEAATKKAGAEHLAMIWPYQRNFHEGGSITAEPHQQVIEAFGEKASAGVLDLRPAMNEALKDHRMQDLFIDFGHTHPLGNRIIGEAIANRIEDWIKTHG